MEWLKAKQPCYGRFEMLLASASRAETRFLMSSTNLGELYYNVAKEWNEIRASEVMALVQRLDVEIVHPNRTEVMFAARLKARYTVSYADTFAATLAIKVNAPVLTGDRDFLLLEKAGLINVDWIGA